ncbi:siderophore ABC transporter substrate-binding protein [Serinibacter arcticus]|uniref:Petrobactin ABC transporter, periplasmic binding protein n=1 Tax=Serinibacter arcticus TaxID=1655435 RepID=A0A4Z1DZ23_9MICO|nr:ABC transporter substrate-binding protein [Serinibacter arcticus]TGO04776.1 Petrobactin ABC transporter, periplasmic binding protein [Serinibacter arcticus]
MSRRSLTARLLTTATAGLAALALAACGGADAGTDTGTDAADATSTSGSGEGSASSSDAGTVTITDNHGEVEVEVNPERVVALDNHVFETLHAWDVPLVAAPKTIMGDVWPAYTDDAAVLDVGSHREPNLEAIIEAQPDLIIGGYRFSESYADIKAQNPQAVVIELAPREGEDPEAEMTRQVEILGQIFDREDDAAAIVADYEDSIATAAEAYNGTDTVIGLITSGGEIAYSAPVTGRSIGVLFPTLGLTPAIEQAAEDVSHGDDISVEAIAAANPDWLVVLDRDGSGVGEGEYTSAQQLISGSEALAGVTAVAQNQIVYLDPDFYLTEDIQAYTALYDQIGEAFGAAR